MRECVEGFVFYVLRRRFFCCAPAPEGFRVSVFSTSC